MPNTKKKTSFKFPLSTFPGEKHPCATKPIQSPNFFPASYDIVDKKGKLVYKQGDAISTMYTMNWEEYGSYPPNLSKWEMDFPEIVKSQIKPTKDQLENLTDERDDFYEQADDTDSIKERDQILRKAKSIGQQIWCMKAVRLGYYESSKGAVVSAEEELQHAESSPVSELRNQTNEIGS